MIFNSKRFLWLLTVFGISGFVYGATVNIDPDFGWHIKLGELILANGKVFATDPFSYTMPSFPFIDHEWLTNVLLHLLYQNFGNILTAFIFTFFGFLAVYLLVTSELGKIASEIKTPILVFITITSLGAFQMFFGIRPQVESWLMFSIFMFFMRNKKLFEKYFYIFPFFQILWTNLHGSFPLSITTLSIYVIVRALTSRKIWWKGLVTLLLCLVATGINPYGFRIWQEIVQQILDSSLRWSVVEWKPSFFFFNVFYLVFVVLFTFSLKRYFKLFEPALVAVNLFFFFQSITSVRHVPIWLLVNIPMQLLVLVDFYNNAGKIKFAQGRFKKLLSGFSMLLLLFFIIGFLNKTFNQNTSLKEDAFYPKKALSYLEENPTKGNIFSDYSWGGYLIWKYPDKKVFIDGRMPSWKWGANLSNETNNAMEEYVDFLNGDLEMEGNFEKYNIDTVLWSSKNDMDTSQLKLDILNRVFKKDPADIFSMAEYLAAKGWKMVYQDEVASIYQKHSN